MRRPKNNPERVALESWHNARPRTAMVILRDSGYSDSERIDWVRNVAGCREDVIHFAMMDRLAED